MWRCGQIGAKLLPAHEGRQPATKSWKEQEWVHPGASRGSTTLMNLEFGLLASGTMREQISVVSSQAVSLWELTTVALGHEHRSPRLA